MSLQQLTEGVRQAALDHRGFPHRIVLRVSGLGAILWDGTTDPPVVSNADEPAEAVIGLGADTLGRFLAGTLDPGEAWMDGLLEVEGSTAAAIALGQLFIPEASDPEASDPESSDQANA